MEDRIYAAGHGERFQRAYDAFRQSSMSSKQQDKFYDELVAMGATGEEANEYVNLCMEN